MSILNLPIYQKKQKFVRGIIREGNGNRKVTRAGKIGLIDITSGAHARTEQGIYPLKSAEIQRFPLRRGGNYE